MGQDIRFWMCSRPRKGTSLGGTACFGVFCVKIRPWPLAVASCKNPKKLTRFWCAKSRMRRNDTPGRIVTNVCTDVGVHDVIICADLYDYRLRVWAWRGVKFWASPLTCVVALTTLSHYRASVWLVIWRFSSGVVPDKLKVAKVIPIYKKEEMCFTSNYRPISLLSIFTKLLEKLMQERLYSFLQ